MSFSPLADFHDYLSMQYLLLNLPSVKDRRRALVTSDRTMARHRVRDLLTRARARAKNVLKTGHFRSVEAPTSARGESLQESSSASSAGVFVATARTGVFAASRAVKEASMSEHSSLEAHLKALTLRTLALEHVLFTELEVYALQSQRVPLSSPDGVFASFGDVRRHARDPSHHIQEAHNTGG